MSEKHVRKLLESLDFTAGAIDTLLSEKEEGEIDVKQTVQDWLPDFDKRRLEESEAIRDKMNDFAEVAVKRAQVDLARGLELGMSRREAEAAKLDDLVSTLKTKMAQGDDSEGLKKQLAAAQDRLDKAQDDWEEKLKGFETEKAELKTTYETQLRSAKLDSLLERKFSGFEFGVSKRVAELAKRGIAEDLKGRYKIDPATGDLKDKEGGTVYDPKDGAKRWKTVDDAIAYELEQAEVLKKSNGKAGDDKARKVSGDDDEKKESEAVKRLKRDYEAAQKKRQGA